MNQLSAAGQPMVLHIILLVRASGASFRRRFLDALEKLGKLVSWANKLCLHPVLPDPAPPPRNAPRPDPPVVCPGLGLVLFSFASSSRTCLA